MEQELLPGIRQQRRANRQPQSQAEEQPQDHFGQYSADAIMKEAAVLDDGDNEDGDINMIEEDNSSHEIPGLDDDAISNNEDSDYGEHDAFEYVLIVLQY